jgi:hypothetical protein
MDEIDWDAREAETHLRLAALDGLLGEWVGTGRSDGAPIRGRLGVRRILSGTFVEAREIIEDADGNVDHEDVCVYRWDPDERTLWVVQLLAPGWIERHRVEPLADGAGIRWITSPVSPRVELAAVGPDALRVRVWMPGEAAPTHEMDYARA